MHTNGSAKARFADMAGTEPARIRIVLVEDHAILQEGLVALLEIEHDLEIVGQAMDAPTALELVRTLRPAVLMTDLSLGGESGISLISKVQGVAPETRSLALTAHDEEEYFRAAMQAGALGYVLKDAGRAELLQAIRSVAAGQQYLCSAMARRVLSGYLRTADNGAAATPATLLTDREREVLAKIADGPVEQSHRGRTHDQRQDSREASRQPDAQAGIAQFCRGHHVRGPARTRQFAPAGLKLLNRPGLPFGD